MLSSRELERMSVEEALRVLGSSAEGLSEEAGRRLAEYGHNEVPERRESSLLAYLRRCWGPLPWLMEVAIAVSYAAGRVFEAEELARARAWRSAEGSSAHVHPGLEGAQAVP